jgi:hypothetical protein
VCVLNTYTKLILYHSLCNVSLQTDKIVAMLRHVRFARPHERAKLLHCLSQLLADRDAQTAAAGMLKCCLSMHARSHTHTHAHTRILAATCNDSKGMQQHSHVRTH